jgi:hypothetical protein
VDELEARFRDFPEEPFQEGAQEVSGLRGGKGSTGKKEDERRPGQGGQPVAEKVLSSQ